MTSDFQRSSTEQGSAFEQAVITVLRCSGWTIVGTHAVFGGAEVDIVADSPTGTRWWIECKGSWMSKVRGSERGDTVKKAVGVAWYLSTLPERCPYMLITSHLPHDGTLGERMLHEAQARGLFSQISTLPFLSTLTTEDSE